MSEMKVALKGLTCANCAGKIEDTLSKLSETQEVSINLLRQEMTVKLAPNASAAAVRRMTMMTIAVPVAVAVDMTMRMGMRMCSAENFSCGLA